MAFYGPQHKEIVSMVRAILDLTPQQVLDIAAVQDGVAWTNEESIENIRFTHKHADHSAHVGGDSSLWRARSKVAETAEWVTTVAWGDAREVPLEERDSRAVAVTAITNAAHALAARHLVDTDDYSTADYDNMTLPWRTVVGPLHADDEDVN